MIAEDYISFETAKLLKEKGFDEGCSFVVNTISKGVMPVSWPTTNSEIEDEKASLVALPTLQMAMKWLREKHHLHIEIRITNHSMSDMVNVVRYYWVMTNTETGRWCDESTVYTVKAFGKSEEAGEDAIRRALEKLT